MAVSVSSAHRAARALLRRGAVAGSSPDVQGVAGDLQVADKGERLPEQGAGLVLATGVVRAQQPGQGGLGVVGARRWLG